MSTKKPDTKPVYRDSKTGRWDTKEDVRRNPSTTETERRPIKSPTSRKGK